MKKLHYESAADYYHHQLELVDAYLYNHLDQFTLKMHTSGHEHAKSKSYISKEDVLNELSTNTLNMSKSSSKDISTIRSNIQRRLKLTYCDAHIKSAFLPLEYLKGVFNLKPFESFVIMLSFAVELDRKYEKIFGYFNDYASRRYPTTQTACLIFDQSPENFMRNMSRFHEDNKLMKYFFQTEECSRSSIQLKLKNAMVNFLMDAELDEVILPEYLELYTPDEYAEAIPEELKNHHDVQSQISGYLEQLAANKSRRVVFNIHGPQGIGKIKQIKSYCKSHSHSGVLLNFERLNHIYKTSYSQYSDALKSIAQTVLLHQAVLILTGVEIEVHRDLLRLFFEDYLIDIARFSTVTFVLSDHALPPLTTPDQKLTLLRIQLNDLTGSERKSLYLKHIQEKKLNLDIDLTSLASKFVFTPDQIDNAVSDAIEICKLEGKDQISSHMLHQACRNQLSHRLDKKAQRIESGGHWDKLVLPDQSKDRLREVCNHVKYQGKVLDEWGFQDHLSYGTGLAVLFAGPPGTGKTLSARILAKELDLELYKVDLSQMISKYIGETEKNINELFEQASGSSAILLFDEGDALFGKRTEVKDSNDKHANVETAYLLQKVESYKGICILTTNLLQNIDPAFLRRFRFIIHYPLPDPESRLKIWAGIYPDRVPLSKSIDFDFLANKFELTGGHIKNIALSSAFTAASNDTHLDMKCILNCIEHEISKTGKSVLKSDFGEYSYLLSE